jgi:hypothetical protein
MTNTVQHPVPHACSPVLHSVSPAPCLPSGERHACTRAARSPHGIGIGRGWNRPRHDQSFRNEPARAARQGRARVTGRAFVVGRTESGHCNGPSAASPGLLATDLAHTMPTQLPARAIMPIIASFPPTDHMIDDHGRTSQALVKRGLNERDPIGTDRKRPVGARAGEGKSPRSLKSTSPFRRAEWPKKVLLFRCVAAA